MPVTFDIALTDDNTQRGLASCSLLNNQREEQQEEFAGPLKDVLLQNAGRAL